MRLAVIVLGTELVAVETGPRTRVEDDDQDEDEAARAGSTLAASELGPTAFGFTPWRHVETDDPKDTHGSVP